MYYTEQKFPITEQALTLDNRTFKFFCVFHTIDPDESKSHRRLAKFAGVRNNKEENMALAKKAISLIDKEDVSEFKTLQMIMRWSGWAINLRGYALKVAVWAAINGIPNVNSIYVGPKPLTGRDVWKNIDILETTARSAIKKLVDEEYLINDNTVLVGKGFWEYEAPFGKKVWIEM